MEEEKRNAMEAEIRRAIPRLAAMSGGMGVKSDDALRFSQAALNLIHALRLLQEDNK